MQTKPLLATLFALLLLSASTVYTVASRVASSVQIRIVRSIILSDGKHSTDIMVDVRDSSGRPVDSGTEVQFQTTAGTLSESRATVFGGVAHVRLTSATLPGVAHVTAFAQGGATDVADIIFTDDPNATFAGNNYMSVSGPGYLAYSATDKIIDARGRKPLAHVNYRNIDIKADRLQIYCNENIVRAQQHVTLSRGGRKLELMRLYYNVANGTGYGLMDYEHALEYVVITEPGLKVKKSPTPIPSTYFTLPDTAMKLLVVARGISYFPGDKVQFRRPRFFQDGVQILSLPYYELAMSSTEVFSDQFISVGTRGLGLELPFYYNLTPRSTGIVYLRHQQQLGRSYYSTNPGWSFDVMQGYSSQGERRYEGSFGLTGVTGSDWGLQWNHSQQFNSQSQGNVYLEFPHHNSVFSTTNFTQQLKSIRWGTNLAAGQTFTGPADTSLRSDIFVETQPHRLSNDYQYTIGTDWSAEKTRGQDLNISQTTQNVNIRAFSRPLSVNKRTTLTTSFTAGQMWTNLGISGPMGLATLSLDHAAKSGAGINLTYDLIYQPHTSDFSGGVHRLSFTYLLPQRKRFQASLFGSAYLDSPDASLLADASYRLNRNWRLIGTATLQRFAGESFNDVQFSLGRRIGSRELQLGYSTFNKRISFDLTTARF